MENKSCHSHYHQFLERNLPCMEFHSLPWPFHRQQILDSSKVKEFADGHFKFEENGRHLSIWVENTEGKGEIACYEQFLLFPQCFQKTDTADT